MKQETSLESLLEDPKMKELISTENKDQINEYINTQEAVAKDPFYIKALAAIGAFFSMQFIILFLAMLKIFDNKAGVIIIGSSAIFSALYLSRKLKQIFFQQLALALAISGNILILIGIGMCFSGTELTAACLSQIILTAVLFSLYDNSFYRFFSFALTIVLSISWIVDQEMLSLIHLLVALQTFVLLRLFLWQSHDKKWLDLAYSLSITLPGSILFLCLINCNDFALDFHTPMWPSSLIMAGSIIYLVFHLQKRFQGSKKAFKLEAWFITLIISSLILASFTNPGILIAIMLLILGYVLDKRFLQNIAYLFLACFIILFYYALHVDLAYKSWIMIGSGSLLLISRELIKRCEKQEAE